MTRYFLGANEFEFAECADGADALDCFEKSEPDWVLMDWQMRRINGLEATRRIVAKHPAARILIVTQHDDSELKRAALQAGALGFVLKENLTDLPALIKTAAKTF